MTVQTTLIEGFNIFHLHMHLVNMFVAKFSKTSANKLCLSDGSSTSSIDTGRCPWHVSHTPAIDVVEVIEVIGENQQVGDSRSVSKQTEPLTIIQATGISRELNLIVYGCFFALHYGFSDLVR